MLSTVELLSAAKRGAGIPSNYRLARVLDLTDSTLQRWNTGRGLPDDAHAVRLAAMAGLDAGYVIACMRAMREKDSELRAIWADMAERLRVVGSTPRGPSNPGPFSEGGEGENGPGDEGQEGPENGALMSNSQNAHYAQSTPADARRRRLAKAALGRALKLKKSH